MEVWGKRSEGMVIRDMQQSLKRRGLVGGVDGGSSGFDFEEGKGSEGRGV